MSTSPPGALAFAAALGASIDELLERAARELLRCLAADRAVLWLKPAWPSRFHPPVIAGPGEPRTAPDSCHLDPLLALWSEAGSTREPVFLIAAEDSFLPFLGPLAGMRAAILIPIWAGDGLLGIALASWTHAVASPELEPLERLAEELALVIAREQSEERAEHALRLSAEIARLSRLLMTAVPAADVLHEVILAARRLTGAGFVAVARASFPLQIDVCDPGDPAARGRLDEQELIRAACTAAAEGRPVEAILPARGVEGSRGRPGEILRIVAHPLEGPREAARILLGGWPVSEGGWGRESSLEPFAHLVAAALRQVVTRDAGLAVSANPGEPGLVLAVLLESVDCGVLLFGPQGRVHAFNERFARMMRIEPASAARCNTFEAILDRLAPRFADPEAFAAQWRDRVSAGLSCRDELSMARPERKVLERFARPVIDRDGRNLEWIEIYRDVTEQREIRRRLLHTDRMATIGRLVSGVAHELNNPLTSIVGYAQLLVSRRPGPIRANDLDPILLEAERASRIAKNLLLLARESRPERLPVNVNEVVERTLSLRGYEMRRGEIRLTAELDRRLPRVLADASQLQQVLLNLILNAEQSIQQGIGRGEIRVRTYRRRGEQIALEVADDGPGVAPEHLEHIFNPFFTTKPPGVGTGLGLSIVYNIVREHGGDVQAESEPGAGARFIVRLPVVTPGAERAKSSPRAEPVVFPAAASSVVGKRPGGRILVVEDEPTVARLIADVLAEEGYAVDTVMDGRDGLDLARRNGYALIICDLRMPNLDGQAFYRELQRDRAAPGRRFIFVTGDTLASHTFEFLQGSGVPYLAKPFRVEELKEMVHASLADTRWRDPRRAAGAPFGPRTAARKR